MIPTLFSIGPFTLHTYGVMTALAFSVSVFLAWRQAQREGIASEAFLDMSLWVILGGIGGGRLLYVIVSWREFSGQWLDVVKLWQGGLVFYGGLVGALAAVWWYCAKHRLPVWKVFDLCAPYAALGHAIGRLGCFFNGCCYGKINQTWGVVFPALRDNQPHLPTQLYESFGDLVIFLGLLAFQRRKKYHGQVLWIYIGAYAVMRFGLEFLRGDEIRGTVVGWLHTSQVIALAMIALATGMLVYLGRQSGGGTSSGNVSR